MPLVQCPHCGEDTFTIAGWAAVDRCASCGRALANESGERFAREVESRSRFRRVNNRPPPQRFTPPSSARQDTQETG